MGGLSLELAFLLPTFRICYKPTTSEPWPPRQHSPPKDHTGPVLFRGRVVNSARVPNPIENVSEGFTYIITDFPRLAHTKRQICHLYRDSFVPRLGESTNVLAPNAPVLNPRVVVGNFVCALSAVEVPSLVPCKSSAQATAAQDGILKCLQTTTRSGGDVTILLTTPVNMHTINETRFTRVYLSALTLVAR